MSADPTIGLTDQRSRERAVAWVRHAPSGTAVVFRKPKRSGPQNNLLHLLLTDVSAQVQYHGRWLDVEAYKDVFTSAYRSSKHQLDMVPGLNGGFAILGMHTSDMRVEEVNDLIEMVKAFGAEHGVVFSDYEACAMRALER